LKSGNWQNSWLLTFTNDEIIDHFETLWYTKGNLTQNTGFYIDESTLKRYLH